MKPNIEIEEKLLGALLAGAEVGDLFERLDPGQFYFLRHAILWESMQLVHQQGKRITVENVTSQLTATNDHRDVGGSDYLQYLIEVARYTDELMPVVEEFLKASDMESLEVSITEEDEMRIRMGEVLHDLYQKFELTPNHIRNLLNEVNRDEES